MPHDRLIRSEVVPGTVNDFRALMKRLGILHKHKWTSSDGKEMLFSPLWSKDNPKTESWSVILFLEAEAAAAGIEAYESPDSRCTQLDFLDGYSQTSPAVDFEPIGQPFVEFIEMVLDEVQRTSGKQAPAHEDASDDATTGPPLPEWFPKRQGTVEKWKQAWRIIVELQESYRDRSEGWELEDPTPKNADYVDALTEQMNWRPTDRTVQDIKRAGRMNLLD